MSMPWPTHEAAGPVVAETRRAPLRFSSTAVTSQPSRSSWRATLRADAAAADDECLHRLTLAHLVQSQPSSSITPSRERDDRAPRRAPCAARTRPSARRTATAAASAATSRRRSGRCRADWPRRRSRRRSSGRGSSTLAPRRRGRHPSSVASASEAAALPPPARRAPRRAASSSGTRITYSASTWRAALARQLDRGRDHLLADRTELHRHEDAA